MRNIICHIIITVATLIIFYPPGHAGELEDRIEDSLMVVEEVMSIPEKGIPSYLFNKSKAIAIFPHVVKGGFVLGGEFGKGIISYRDEKTGQWSPPAFFTIGGGSLGFQAGIQSIDLVLLIMSKRGLKGFLKSKTKLGGDIGVAAGPVGRRAEAGIDVLLNAEILSYSRSKGLFAGASIAGATVFEDTIANHALYGKELTAREILFEGEVQPPPVAQKLIKQLGAFSHQVNEE